MPNLTLIVGGPDSGKTSEVVSRLAARYEADPFAETVVLVPTVRHGDQLRRRLVARCGAALRLRVETIPQFSRQMTEGARAPSRMLAGELLARTYTAEGSPEAGLLFLRTGDCYAPAARELDGALAAARARIDGGQALETPASSDLDESLCHSRRT